VAGDGTVVAIGGAAGARAGVGRLGGTQPSSKMLPAPNSGDVKAMVASARTIANGRMCMAILKAILKLSDSVGPPCGDEGTAPGTARLR
jgi:hypothetical protein